ncbi:50S ribosomal protein L25 [candidate division WOR-3 bacterium]|nr:50S ribosomal protein L25 [candidate division WOR-3 bacterium]
MKLKAEIRTQKGKGSARTLRREEKIPAILYGHGEKNVLLQIKEKEINDVVKSGMEHFSLDFGKEADVIIKDIQWNPVTSRILHIDFQYLHKGEKIKVKVPIVFEGVPIGVKEQGGIVEHILSEVEVECLPRDIPREIKVDVSPLKIGDSVHLKDITEVKGKFIEDIERTIVTILAPKVTVEEKPPEEELEEISAEPEVIGEKKEEEKEEKEKVDTDSSSRPQSGTFTPPEKKK